MCVFPFWYARTTLTWFVKGRWTRSSWEQGNILTFTSMSSLFALWWHKCIGSSCERGLWNTVIVIEICIKGGNKIDALLILTKFMVIYCSLSNQGLLWDILRGSKSVSIACYTSFFLTLVFNENLPNFTFQTCCYQFLIISCSHKHSICVCYIHLNLFYRIELKVPVFFFIFTIFLKML